MFGFLFGLAVGAGVASGGSNQPEATPPSVIWRSENLVGRKIDPSKLAFCIGLGRTVPEKMASCFAKPDQWEIVQIESIGETVRIIVVQR